jgi:hypothetical protein
MFRPYVAIFRHFPCKDPHALHIEIEFLYYVLLLTVFWYAAISVMYNLYLINTASC